MRLRPVLADILVAGTLPRRPSVKVIAVLVSRDALELHILNAERFELIWSKSEYCPAIAFPKTRAATAPDDVTFSSCSDELVIGVDQLVKNASSGITEKLGRCAPKLNTFSVNGWIYCV